jgi:polar amino acid transport system substrate-binding protein
MTIGLGLNGQDSTLTIGLKSSPPFIVQDASGRPAGLSYSFWELIDDQVPAKITYQWFDNVEAMLSAVARNEVDFSINPITVTEQRMDSLDFSQPYFISGTALARKEGSTWGIFIKNFFSTQFFSALAILLGIIFVFGFMVWLFERRKEDNEQFRKSWRGIFDGFWWSAVTMTTVGYGDKSPQTTGGRTIAFVWMFVAILMISGLTAGVASALTVSSIESKIETVEDLRRFSTGTIQATGTAEYLGNYGLPNNFYKTVEDGLEALKREEIDVFVFDRPVLRFYLEKGSNSELVIDQRNLKTDYYSFAYPKNSKLRETLDPKIVRALKSDSWNFILRKASSNKD